MSKVLKPGDKVSWSSAQGKVTGTVKKELTGPTEIKGNHVAASASNPQFLVESESSGRQAAHKPDTLRKKGAA